MTQNLHGLTAVVTGAGDGIGRAVALRLAKRGAHVAILDIRELAARQTAQACAAFGYKAIGLACDVSLRDQIERSALRVRAELGPVALLWANAGLGIAGGLSTARRDQLSWMTSVNVDGMIDTIQAFVPQMLMETGWRHVAITGSMSGLTPVGDNAPSAYAMTKYAVVGIAEGLRGELASSGIGVTLFCPGIINTRIWDGGRARPDRFGGPTNAPEDAGALWREVGMDADEVAEIAVGGVCAGDFYVVVPESEERAATLAQRARAIEAGIHIPSRRA